MSTEKITTLIVATSSAGLQIGIPLYGLCVLHVYTGQAERCMACSI